MGSLIWLSLWRPHTLYSSMTAHRFVCSGQVSRSRHISHKEEPMSQPLSDEVEQFLQSLNSADQKEGTSQDEPQETIHAETLFAGADGVQVSTDETVTVPAGNPPVYGQSTVPAHAVNAGEHGNLAPGDINATVAIAVIAKNTAAFTGGQDARDFQTV